jgi:hypothetical protein
MHASVANGFCIPTVDYVFDTIKRAIIGERETAWNMQFTHGTAIISEGIKLLINYFSFATVKRASRSSVCVIIARHDDTALVNEINVAFITSVRAAAGVDRVGGSHSAIIPGSSARDKSGRATARARRLTGHTGHTYRTGSSGRTALTLVAGDRYH